MSLKTGENVDQTA